MARPFRMICISAESADILCRLGAGNRIVGVSAYAKLPATFARIPRISGFSGANIKRILALKPDLVIGYSDVQADIAAKLIKAGLNVLITHQTTLSEIEDTILLLGRIIGKDRAAIKLARRFASLIAPRASRTRPRVYFEGLIPRSFFSPDQRWPRVTSGSPASSSQSPVRGGVEPEQMTRVPNYIIARLVAPASGAIFPHGC